MKRIFIKGIGIAAFSSVAFACSGPKQVTEQEVAKAAVNTPTNELVEQKQAEFEYYFVEALKQKMFGNAQEAIRLLSSCLEIDPNSSAAMFELANIHAANNDFTSASLLLEKAISLNPENKWYKLLLAQVYQQTRKYSEAADIYAGLLEKEPENLEYIYMNAALLATAQRFDEAISAYNRMEKETGINEQISVAKQQIYISTGEIDKAFAEINKLIENNPDEAKYYGLLADLYQSQGDSENALKNYQKIQEMDPENGFVHFSLANYYLENGDTEKSFEETKEGFASDAVDIQTKMQLYMMLTANPAQSTLNEKQRGELIDVLLEKHPDESLVHTIQAEELLKQNKLPEGREALLKALDINPNDYMVWERVMYIDNDLQQWDKLYEHTGRIIELFPNQPQGYFFKAIACVQLEKFDETIELSDEGADYVIDNPQLKANFLMLKGEAIYKNGNKTEAFKIFDKAVEIDPENYLTLNNYAYYLSLDGIDLDKAERMSGKVVERFPDNATYLDTHAWVLFKKGEYTLAKFYMDSAIKNSDDESDTLLEHYGDILYKTGKKEQAVEYWKKAKESGSESQVLDRKIKEQTYIEE
ncbi:tetratricopeptide repeat protein [Draconibacterium sp. IB214405]|uniref:tetratricopeptide repeat protein n=1 Tax=Draconibacterium sp. IB214405 TaxID=3097352 RepID=UPI002A113E04|nr:tetratricopeptide repeat protein [Draconibacterium sp. IB214405]MDX8337823.1 tetratricopeptide repeat protein [Draconibacterium sp. IB214405]